MNVILTWKSYIQGGNTSKVEVRLSASENRLTIAVDEEDRGDLMTWRDAIPNQFTGVHLQRVHNSSLLVQFANGIGFMVSLNKRPNRHVSNE